MQSWCSTYIYIFIYIYIYTYIYIYMLYINHIISALCARVAKIRYWTFQRLILTQLYLQFVFFRFQFFHSEDLDLALLALRLAIQVCGVVDDLGILQMVSCLTWCLKMHSVLYKILKSTWVLLIQDDSSYIHFLMVRSCWSWKRVSNATVYTVYIYIYIYTWLYNGYNMVSRYMHISSYHISIYFHTNMNHTLMFFKVPGPNWIAGTSNAAVGTWWNLCCLKGG